MMFRSLCVLVFSVAAIAQITTDRQVAGLQGKMKTLREEEASLEGKVGKWKEINRGVIHTIAWDKSGYEIERIMFGGNPFTGKREALLKIISSHNQATGTKLEKSYDLHKPDPNNQISFVPLDANGKQLPPPPPREPRPTEKDGASVSEVVYKNDAAGNRQEELGYEGRAGKSKLSYRTVYRWSKSGKLQEELWYENDKPAQKTVYKFDEQGNETEKIVFDKNGKNTSHDIYSEYKFDDQGNWVSRVTQMDYVAAYQQRIKTYIITYRQITYWQ